MKGISNSQLRSLTAVGIVTAIAAAGYWGWSGGAFGGFGGPKAQSFSLQEQVAQVGTIPGAVTGQTCPDTGLSQIHAGAYYIDTSNSNNVTAVNTTVSLYRPGDQAAYLATTTSATAGASLIGSLNCGAESIKLFVGDQGTTYYTRSLTFNSLNTAITPLQLIELKRSSAATLSYSNSTNFGQASVHLSNTTAYSIPTAGGTTTAADVVLSAGANYYGDGQQEICASYNTTNISKVSFSLGGVSLTEIPRDASITLGAGQSMKCYVIPGDLNNNVQRTLDTVITASSGVIPNNASINIYVNDYSGYIKNGVYIPAYFNPDTNADLGLAVVSTTNAIIVNYV